MAIRPFGSAAAEGVLSLKHTRSTKEAPHRLGGGVLLCVTHTIRIFSAKCHGGGELMSGFPPWHLQVLLSLQLLRHLLEKIRRPQVKRDFIPNEAADILFGGGVVDFVKAFAQNRLQRLQIK